MSMENFVPEDPLVMRLWMKTIHSKSPLYQATRKQVSQMSGKHLGLKYELISLEYLATDGDHAIARILQRPTHTPQSTSRTTKAT